MTRRSLLIVLIAALALAAAAAAGYWFYGKGTTQDTVTAKRGTAVLAVYATGEVEPVIWSTLSAITTATLLETHVHEGDEVKAGDVLARLDDSVERSQLVQYRAQLNYYARERDRQMELQRTGVASKRAYDEAVSRYAEFRAKVASQESLVQRLRIISPIDGVILKQDGEPGELIKQGEAIITVGRPGMLQVTAEVDEEDIALVRPEQKVLIKADAFPDDAIEGEVREITPRGDPINKSFRVRIKLPGDTKLLIGMTAEVNIIVREKPDALLVPASAVIDGKVFIPRGRKATPVPVKTGIVTETTAEIIEGLSEGQAILAHPEPDGSGRSRSQ